MFQFVDSKIMSSKKKLMRHCGNMCWRMENFKIMASLKFHGGAGRDRHLARNPELRLHSIDDRRHSCLKIDLVSTNFNSIRNVFFC